MRCNALFHRVLPVLTKYLEKTFCYKLTGRVKDKNKGLIDVYGFIIHINEQEIPNDIENGMYIEFTTSRIDLW